MATAAELRKMMNNSANGKACAKAVKEALAYIDKTIKEAAKNGESRCSFFHFSSCTKLALVSFAKKNGASNWNEFFTGIRDNLCQNGFNVSLHHIGIEDVKMEVAW